MEVEMITSQTKPLKFRLGFLIAGIVLSGSSLIGGTALLLRQRNLISDVSLKSAEDLERDISDLNQQIENSKKRENEIFENEGMNVNFFKQANETSELDIEKSVYEEVLAEKNASSDTQSSKTNNSNTSNSTLNNTNSDNGENTNNFNLDEPSNREILAEINSEKASRLSPFINLLFLISPFPALIGISLFLKRN